MRDLNIPVTTHGRLLIDAAASASPLKLFVGFHGYAQSADEMMEMLRGIPAGAAWTRLSIQALHRFYRGRSEVTVASWMTRQDRELLVGDNVAYVDAAIAQVAGVRAIDRLVFCGFSQGVPMAFRAGLLGARRADAMTFPRVLLSRGERDDWYTDTKLQADESALRARGCRVETLVFDGAHEWNIDFATRAAVVLAGL
jgi:predicted esterase